MKYFTIYHISLIETLLKKILFFRIFFFSLQIFRNCSILRVPYPDHGKLLATLLRMAVGCPSICHHLIIHQRKHIQIYNSLTICISTTAIPNSYLKLYKKKAKMGMKGRSNNLFNIFRACAASILFSSLSRLYILNLCLVRFIDTRGRQIQECGSGSLMFEIQK